MALARYHAKNTMAERVLKLAGVSQRVSKLAKVLRKYVQSLKITARGTLTISAEPSSCAKVETAQQVLRKIPLCMVDEYTDTNRRSTN